MPKKKKTLKQKIQSDQRQREPSNAQSYSLPTPATHVLEKTVKPVRTHVITTDYSYLSRDLSKTAILTGLIIIGELLIRFFTRGV
jgi:hypothetical protein